MDRRNKAVGVVNELAQTPDAALLSYLKKRSLRSLKEMARWKNLGYAESAFRILGRITGLSETQITAFWKTENREKQIEKFLLAIKAASQSKLQRAKTRIMR